MVAVTSGKTFPTDYSELNKYSVTRRGKEVAIIGAGAFYGLGEQVADALKEKGIDATLINPRFLSGLDEELLKELEADHRLVITLEDGCLDGGFGEKIARYYGTSDMAVKCYGLKKEFANRYDYTEMARAHRLTAPQILDDVLTLLSK